jgi:hypothetical protein
LRDCAQIKFGFGKQGLDTLHRINLIRQLRQYGGLITAAGADFQRLTQLTTGPQDFDHARHDVGLRDRLRKPER